MGWGYRRYGRSAPVSKSASAHGLSAATLQCIVAEKEALAQQQAENYRQQVLNDAERVRGAAEEAKMEEQHGTKEELAKWRTENAERLAAEQVEAYEKAS
jgi:hypothetical protein